jgi:hypothetical protein
LTQRKLTEAELTNAREAYLRIGRLYKATNSNWELVRACCLLCSMIQNGTSDGNPPIQVGRVPTAADIGKRVKVRSSAASHWSTDSLRLAGILANGHFVVEKNDGAIRIWDFATIDLEAGE